VAEISAAQVKALREKTGAGMMDCKKALVEAGGDVSRAQDLLRERGLVKARTKSGRATSEGRVAVAVADDGRSAVLVEVNCETDFVAKTDQFQALGQRLAELALAQKPADVDALLGLPVDSGTAKDQVMETIAGLGENIQVRRLAHMDVPEKGFVGHYVHAGGKIAAVVGVEAEDPAASEVRTFAKSLCMHVTALQPLAVSSGDLPADEVEKERAVLRKQAEAEGKPPQVIDKMVEGRLRKYFSEVVLLEQGLVTDPDRTVENAAKEVGARVVSFRRESSSRSPANGWRRARDSASAPRRCCAPLKRSSSFRRRGWRSPSSAAAATSSAGSMPPRRGSTGSPGTTWGCSPA
jgi:elongation factor Ts